MYASILKKAFDPYYNAPITIWEYFSDLCEEITFKKNQKIKEVNTVSKFGYFLLEGACGFFVFKKNYFVCTDLYLENCFFGDNSSLFTGKASPVEIVALENSKLLRISKSNIDELKKMQIGALLFHTGELHSNIEKQQQQIEMMTMTAEEKYMNLLETNPEVLKRIHQKHIASYLGITPQSLSRIRKKVR
ncbi:Crp/Fnr family transcriptional regulator [Tenacibaculum sp. 190524A02b]|uniref:Crp/Fnr family transcriptional regulator n=1 Tax=Tenacibaculum vairaonense TaxID=3137860 RepID=A0ABM9PK77_9FLAO